MEKNGQSVSRLTAHMIQFDCPKCLRQINARADQSGKRIDCRNCGASLRVPQNTAGVFDDLFGDDEGVENVVGNPSQLLQDDELSTLPPQIQRSGRRTEGELEASGDEVDVDDVGGDAGDTADGLDAADGGDDLFSNVVAENVALTTEITEEDPFTVDLDRPLQIDGVTDAYSIPGSFSFKCTVCGSYLLGTQATVGSKIRCADCHSNLTVPNQVADSKSPVKVEGPTDKRNAQRENTSVAFGAEPISGEVEVDPSFGFTPVEADLLAPKAVPGSDEISTSQTRDDSPLPPSINRSFKAKKSDQSKTEARSTQATGRGRHAAEVKKPHGKPIRTGVSRSSEASEREHHASERILKADSFPDFEFDALFGAMGALIAAPNVMAAGAIAASLIAAGNFAGHVAINRFSSIEDPTMGDLGRGWLMRVGLGWTLFAIGSILLWYFAGVVFRKTAAGDRRVNHWRMGPSVEWTSTFLLIGFSFSVAGLPLLLTGATWAIAPLRLFLALPMLLSVWYAQSPFHIIAVDAFDGLSRQRRQWQSVLLVVLTLAGIALAAGLLLAVPTAYLNIVGSAVGAMLISMVTLGYAAVAGWHSGKVVKELK